MHVFVIGGTGFISSRMVDMLLSSGHSVDMLTRGVSKNNLTDRKGLTHIIGDRNVKNDLVSAMGSKKYDAVYDMIAFEPAHTEGAIRACKGKTARFIHCSTISVYMISDQITCPVTIDQDDRPIMPFWPQNPFGMDYGIHKRECEELLWAHHDPVNFPVTVLRPTFVSGPGDPARRDYFWIQRIMDGGPLLVPGSGDIAFQQVYVDDVARAFAAMLDTEKTKGKKYNVAAEEMYSLKEYLIRLAELLGKTPEIVMCDQAEFDTFSFSSNPSGDVFPFNTRRTSVFDLFGLKKDTGYQSTPFEVWMKETIDWFLTRHNRLSTGYEYRELELAAIQQLKTQKVTRGRKA